MANPVNPSPTTAQLDAFQKQINALLGSIMATGGSQAIDASHFGFVTDINESLTDADTLVVNTISSDNPWPGAANISFATNGGGPGSYYTPNFSAGSNSTSATGAGYRWPKYGSFAINNTGTGVYANTATYYIWGFSNDAVLLLPGSIAGAYSTATGTTSSTRNFTETVGSAYRPIVLYLGGDASTLSNISFETYLSAFCFAEGTRIETADGMMAVEDLKEGQLVRTASGDLRPIQWIGETRTRPALHPRPHEVQPVCVRPHAFGPNMPSREVRFTPGHAIYVDGVLVPVGYLVNGATIVQEAVERIRYFHVELETHDVLLAEGLPCESYLDDGNRASFVNAEGFYDLHGRLDPQNWDDACAPLVAAGPQLIALQRRLEAQAEALGWVRSEDADLVIEADGVAVAPVRALGNRYWFALPAAETLVLRSNASVLAHVLPGLGDGRTLGVAVAELRIDGEAIALDDAAFGQGFYPLEQHGDHGWRWTDGAAVLGRPLGGPAMVEVTLAMVAPSWQRRAPELKLVANG